MSRPGRAGTGRKACVPPNLNPVTGWAKWSTEGMRSSYNSQRSLGFPDISTERGPALNPPLPAQKLRLVLFYWAFASFTLGISVQEASVAAFGLLQIGIALFYKSNLISLMGRGRAPALLFFAAVIASAVAARYRFPNAEDTPFHWALVVFWLPSMVLSRQIRWDLLHRTMLVVSIPGLLYSCYWLLQPDELAWAGQVGFSMYPRASGLVSNPITHAETLLVISGWSLARLHAPLPRLERRLIWGHLGFCATILVFSRLRSGLLVLATLLVISALSSPELRKKGILLCTIMVITFLAFIRVFGFNLASIEERFVYISSGIELIQEHPIFGIGPDQFHHFQTPAGDTLRHPHNTVLGITAETGLLGLITYLLLMGTVAWRLFILRARTANKPVEERWVTQAFVYVFISYWLFGLFDYNFADTELLILHALHWGLIVQLSHRGGTSSSVSQTLNLAVGGKILRLSKPFPSGALS